MEIEDDGKDEEERNLNENLRRRTYNDAPISIRELQDLSHHNNSQLFDTICRARILLKNQSSRSTTYLEKSLLHWWKQ
jgi:hypothetical protein